VIWVWYDYLCPFSYLGQDRTRILRRHGLQVIELPLQIHPDLPPGGIPAWPRRGGLYERLDLEARVAGLELRWPARLPVSKSALAAAEWVRRHAPSVFRPFHRALYEAHFALGEDIESPDVIHARAAAAGVNLAELRAAIADGRASAALARAESSARRKGVRSTPAWLTSRGRFLGLQSREEFVRLARSLPIEMSA
jgi:2-hydroxychromene-2-carboxylate isomerase